jgi:hypothetical protein
MTNTYPPLDLAIPCFTSFIHIATIVTFMSRLTIVHSSIADPEQRTSDQWKDNNYIITSTQTLYYDHQLLCSSRLVPVPGTILYKQYILAQHKT